MEADRETLVIKAGKGWVPYDLNELWRYRELLYFFVWRDVKVKYKQSLLGAAWIIMRPVVTMIIFSYIFGRLARFPSEGAPYPIFLLLGLLPWTFFSTSLNATAQSLVSSSHLISKIYFPRVLIPVSSGLGSLFDFLVSLTALVGMMFYYKVVPQAGLLGALALIPVLFLSSLGPGLVFGALNVKYRDIKEILPFVVQIWMYVTPVIYPAEFIPEKYRMFMYLNPMAGPIEAFRAAVLGHAPLNTKGFLLSVSVGMAILLFGIYYFRKVEQTFADVI